MLEGFFNLNFPKIFEDIRRLPKTYEDFRRLPMISEDFIKSFKMLEGHLEHFATFSDFFRRFPKIFKNSGKLSECLSLHSLVLFPKFFKEFPNIQQRRHEPLLPVTDQPLNFFMYVINK